MLPLFGNVAAIFCIKVAVGPNCVLCNVAITAIFVKVAVGLI